MSTFNSILLKISGELVGDQLKKMKFLCNKEIGKNRLEKMTSGLQLFMVLMERNTLGPDNTVFLVSLLTDIGRLDLADKLTNCESQYAGSPNSLPNDEEQAKLDIATEMITNNIGRKWRTYGRKLCLPEAKLDHIAQKHPNNLEEQVVELLKEWLKKQKAEAKTDTLIKALRSCDQNCTADLIQTELEKLNANGGQ
ncbi:LOW QUALITY PROTEIN: FAS-associated death domain protein-like [Oncorhynchus kisutch]|uniref:LOW QUALITY PROTEIN: FAS-associated death domain protein-like n=1 Tax=Oncorhynchus kisutch TaxID=8019 RepID=UPI00099F6DEC|nr:LOW QUALITY PROTEIN: FAS-associated death domain protein-like [Oncorhynchus kisutch]